MQARTAALFGVAVGGISIVFSLLCLGVAAVFTPAVILAVVFGLMSGGIAWGLGARRTARVAMVMSVLPVVEWLLMDNVAESAGTALLALLPLLAALGFAVWMLVDYLRQRAARPQR